MKTSISTSAVRTDTRGRGGEQPQSRKQEKKKRTKHTFIHSSLNTGETNWEPFIVFLDGYLKKKNLM